MPNPSINLDFFENLIKAPEQVLSQIDLIYTNNNHLKINRLKRNKKFQYVINGNPISNKKDLKRIQSIGIPPAWQNVKISEFTNGHLQAIGRDSKNRKQYRYHPVWTKIRNQTKFFKMVSFAENLPLIRSSVEHDLKQKKWTQSKVIALIISLMEETHIRIGNDQYAKRNKTYGLTTLRNKHVDIYNDRLKFEFIGKKGKKHSITIRNKKLINLVNKCEEIPGWELFQYYDSEGVKKKINSECVNEYLQSVTNNWFTAKDFRTWSATLIAFESLKEQGISYNSKTQKSNIIKAYDTAAKELGNTRNVCKKYYVHPYIINTYLDHSIQSAFKEAESNTNQPNFLASEMALLHLIKNYAPKLSSTNY